MNKKFNLSFIISKNNTDKSLYRKKEFMITNESNNSKATNKETRWVSFVTQFLKDLESISEKDIKWFIINRILFNNGTSVYWNFRKRKLSRIGVQGETHFLFKLQKGSKDELIESFKVEHKKLLELLNHQIKSRLLEDEGELFRQTLGKGTDYINYSPHYREGYFSLDTLRDVELIDFFRIILYDKSFQKHQLSQDGKLLGELEKFQNFLDIAFERAIEDSVNVFFERINFGNDSVGVYSLLNIQRLDYQFQSELYYKYWIKVVEEIKTLPEDEEVYFISKAINHLIDEKQKMATLYLSHNQFNKFLGSFLSEGSGPFEFRTFKKLVEFASNYSDFSQLLTPPESVKGLYTSTEFIMNDLEKQKEVLTKLNKYFPNSTFEFTFDFKSTYSFTNLITAVMDILSYFKPSNLSNIKFKLKEKDKEKLNLFLNQPELLTTDRLDTQKVLEILEYLKGEG